MQQGVSYILSNKRTTAALGRSVALALTKEQNCFLATYKCESCFCAAHCETIAKEMQIWVILPDETKTFTR
jgi:hypothetical protein